MTGFELWHSSHAGCISYCSNRYWQHFPIYVTFFVCSQIEIDSKFLEAQHIMDYSLLLGVHYRAPQHLRSLMFYQGITADGLEMLAEEGEAYFQNWCSTIICSWNFRKNIDSVVWCLFMVRRLIGNKMCKNMRVCRKFMTEASVSS